MLLMVKPSNYFLLEIYLLPLRIQNILIVTPRKIGVVAPPYIVSVGVRVILLRVIFLPHIVHLLLTCN